MSATIYWEPACVDMKEKHLSCWAPSSFMEQLENRLGERPPTYFDEEDLIGLRELAKTNCDGGGNPFQELVNAIQIHGSIRVWPEY